MREVFVRIGRPARAAAACASAVRPAVGRPRHAFRVLLLVVSSVLSIGVLEGALRLMLATGRLPSELAVADFRRLAGASIEDAKWKRRFVQRHEKGEVFLGGLYAPHPTRGWTVRAGVEVVDEYGIRYRTNRHGQRSLAEFPSRPGRPVVLVLGDSFTFGMAAHHHEAWPTILGELDDGLEVANLAVGGYGLDQMLVTLAESFDEYRPAAVVLAFIGDDLNRTLLSFRDYAKPRYLVAEDRLLLTGVPIPPPEQMLGRLREEVAGEAPPLLLAARVLLNAWWRQSVRLDMSRDAFALSTRIVEEGVRVCGRRQVPLLLVHLALWPAFFDSRAEDEGERFALSLRGRRGLRVVLTRPRFLAQPGPWKQGHYGAREARVVAETVHEALREAGLYR